MKHYVFYVALFAISFLASCSKTPVIIDTGSEIEDSISTPGSNIITHNKNLTIVYFIPNDLDTVANWKARLSDVMIYAQKWYGEQMVAAGYGFKTFGLAKDSVSGRVKIELVRGQNPKVTYGTGANAYASEINAYFDAHPGVNSSNHVLILLPAFGYDNNSTEGPQPLEGMQPFYGYGKWCFAMDNVYMDMALKGVINPGRNNFAKWVGGMLHELGHAFNAPHDRQWASQNIWNNGSNTNYKMSLMWLSNYFLEVRPCFITDADAAIFNACEVFNDDGKTYYGNITAAVNKLNASYSTVSGAILVDGKFTSSGTVKNILYYNDPNVNNEGTGTNKDYNAITWASKPIGSDSFHISIPISDLEEKADGIPYELKVKLVHDNGVVNETIYGYTFKNGLPVINISTDPRPELNKSGWTITANSEEAYGQGAIAAIDGNAGTWWHSKWSSAPIGVYPYTLTVNMGSSKTTNGVSLTQRTIASQSRPVRDFQILISNDGVNYSLAGSYMANKINGAQYFSFDAPKTFQYFKLVAIASWDGTQNASIAELGLY